ncbi:MAG: hypothetical protein GWO85_00040 [Simkaniaceae bacterium]|nr:hypothetical protein [Simkaniaceae bacterium]
MAEPSRYSVGGDESAKDGILKNKLEIKDQKTLEDTETLLLKDSYEYFLGLLEKGNLKFDQKLIFEINKYFLETLYSWAGKSRTVEISKNGVLFCASSQINVALEKLDEILGTHLPSEKDSKKEVGEKLSVIHCEFNAIHPFREGNGRTIRLFLDLLAASLGFDVIDFAKTSQENYINGCKLGMNMEYDKMSRIIYKGLSKIK